MLRNRWLTARPWSGVRLPVREQSRIDDLPVADVRVDDAAAAAVVAAGAGDNGLARPGGDSRSFVDRPGPIHANHPIKFRAEAELGL
jgi:hypothetical protein